MTIKRFPWAWLFALLAGFGLGLFYAWVVSPVKYVNTEPRALRDDFKDYYRSAIAAAYASNADLERARARLALLGDPDPSQALAAQAQRMLAAGESPEALQQVALLASVLQGQAPANSPGVATVPPTNNNEIASQAVSTPTVSSTTVTVEPSKPTSETEPTGTPVLLLTATPKPTSTPTPTLGAPYQLVGQDTVCDAELAEGLLQVVVTNAVRKQIPGAEIIITWNSGEEHIFTGLKPELGYGYADFLMRPNITYSVRMADGGTPASELSIPACTNTDGEAYLGGVRLTFQQP
jgi:hypothetical protein